MIPYKRILPKKLAVMRSFSSGVDIGLVKGELRYAILSKYGIPIS